MTFLRQWLLGVVSCAFLVSILRQLIPKGTMQELFRFTGGLVLLLALLRPLGAVELKELTLDLSDYEAAVEQARENLQAQRDSAISDGIAARTGAYIEDKAAQLGLSVTAQVAVQGSGDAATPYRVTLYGAENEELAVYIEHELGIPRERQEWRAGE